MVEGEDDAYAFFEQVGPVQLGVSARDPGEFALLVAGEVFGVLPQGIPAVLQRFGRLGGGPGWCVLSGPASGAFGLILGYLSSLVPRLAAYFVEGVGGPFDDVEHVSSSQGVRAAFLDDLVNLLGAVRADMSDRGTPARLGCFELGEEGL